MCALAIASLFIKVYDIGSALNRCCVSIRGGVTHSSGVGAAKQRHLLLLVISVQILTQDFHADQLGQCAVLRLSRLIFGGFAAGTFDRKGYPVAGKAGPRIIYIGQNGLAASQRIIFVDQLMGPSAVG